MSLIVFDAIVRHQLYVEGLKQGRVSVLNSALLKTDEELRKALAVERFDELGELSKTKLRELVRTLREVVRTSIDPYIAEMLRWFEFYMREDRKILTAVYEQFSDKPSEPTAEERLWGAIAAAPMGANGILLGVFLASFGTTAVLTIDRLVNQAYANKLTKNELQRSIIGSKSLQYRDGALNRLFKQGRAVNNTIIQHITAQVNVNVAKGLFAEYEWVSVLDDRTTAICIDRDGKRWPFGAGPVPPAHVGCRSTIVPVIAGQPSPPATFSAWIRTQPSEVVRDIFGMQPNSFVNPKPLTLEQFGAKRSMILQP